MTVLIFSMRVWERFSLFKCFFGGLGMFHPHMGDSTHCHCGVPNFFATKKILESSSFHIFKMDTAYVRESP